MNKPLIGITTDLDSTRNAYRTARYYTEAVSAAGGIPVQLPFGAPAEDIPQLLDSLNGVLLTGGPDLDPSAWGEAVHPSASTVDPRRERYERALVAELERRRMPTLGICLGSQLMNVSRGGSLAQHVPDLGLTPTIEHARLNDIDGRHAISIVPGSLLHGLLGVESLEANSAHHQAYAKIGAGMRVTAHAPDGIPEAVEDPTLPFWLGVQWHPERIFAEAPHHRLFHGFITAAASARDRQLQAGQLLQSALAPSRRRRAAPRAPAFTR